MRKVDMLYKSLFLKYNTVVMTYWKMRRKTNNDFKEDIGEHDVP